MTWRLNIDALPSHKPSEASSRLGLQNLPSPVYYAIIIALAVNVLVSSVWVAVEFGGLKDLDSFLHSGAAYARGLNPYDHHWWLKPAPISPEALNLNPPASVYIFEPLAAMDREVLGYAFLVSIIAMVGVSVALLMRAYPDKRHWLFVLVVVSMAGVWQMVWYMQIYAPLILAMVGAWLLLRRGEWLLAGLLIGLVIAMKPNYGLVALVLLAAGHYKPAAASLVTAGVISLIPIVVDGPQVYWQWLHLTQEFDGYHWTSNSSVVTVGERLEMAPAGQLAALVIGLTIIALSRRWRPDVLTAVGLGTMGVLLVGPVSWAGYTLLLLPYLFSIHWDRWTWVAVGMLALPFAPIPAIGSLGIDLAGSGVASGAQSFLPAPLPTVMAAVILPLVAAIYVWAILLLLTRLCFQLASERGDAWVFESLRRRLAPAPARRPRVVRPRVPAGSPSRGAVAVQVRSDL